MCTRSRIIYLRGIIITVLFLILIKSSSSSKSNNGTGRLRVPSAFNNNDVNNINNNNYKFTSNQKKGIRSGRLLPASPRVYRCGDIGREMVINFVNDQYPEDDRIGGDCTFRLVIDTHDICQVRVDLVDTELLPPTRGECLSQSLTVEGAIWPTGLSPICGVNNDQHFYLHLEPWSGNTSLIDFKVVSILKGKPYRFGIWLTQMDCSASNVLKAPEGCTQFFLSEVGTIKSFNFEGLRYLNGQNYQICIRTGRGVCGIRYDSAPGDFRVKKSITAPKEMLLRSGAGTAACSQDFVMIPDGRGTTSSSREKRLLFRRPRPTPPPKKKATNNKPKYKSVAKRKLELSNSQDRFCGGTLSPSGGESVNKPVFARVRSNLISLRIKTSPFQEFKRKTEAMNLTSGFHLKYTQLRNCDEYDDIDMVTLEQQQQQQLTLPQMHIMSSKHPPNPNRPNNDNSFLSYFMNNNGSHQGQDGMIFDRGGDVAEDNDEIWEYLETEEELVDGEEDDDVYDYFD